MSYRIDAIQLAEQISDISSNGIISTGNLSIGGSYLTNGITITPWINAKTDFDAKGDGVTNDTTALQNAIDAAANGTLFIPDGTYVITPTGPGNFALKVSSPVKIQLSKNATIINSVGDFTGMTMLVINANDVTVSGGTWDWNISNYSTGTNGTIIEIIPNGGTYYHRLTVENTTIINSNNYGVVAVDSDDFTIRNCTLHNTFNNAIHVVCQTRDIARITIEDNYFPDDINDTVRNAVKVVNNSGGSFILKGFIITNNRIMHPFSPTNVMTGIEIWADSDIQPNRFGSVADNYISGSQFSISLNNCHSSTVVGNTCFSASHYGIELANSSNCLAAGNAIDGGGILLAGINVNDHTGTFNVVSGNTITNIAISVFSTGIYTEAEGTAITGNNIRVTGAGNQVYGIEINNANNQSIIGNYVFLSNCNVMTTDAITVFESSNITVSTNTINTVGNGVHFTANTNTCNFLSAHGNNIQTPGSAVNLSGSLFGSAVSSDVDLGYLYMISTNENRFALISEGTVELRNNAFTTPIGILSGTVQSSKTSNYNVLVLDSGTHFNNAGAAGAVNFTLPTASPGLYYTFSSLAAQNMIVNANSGATIHIGTSVTATSGNINASTIGSTITIEAMSSTSWIATSQLGTWTVH